MTAMVKAATIEELRARGAPQLFTQTSAEWKAIFTAWWETSEDGPRRKLYPAQTETLLIDMLSYGFALLGQEAQAASEQRWLPFQVGAHADLGAANNSTFRLKAQPAVTTLRFSIEAGRSGSTTVPAGTEVAAGESVFATADDLVIAEGELIGEVAAIATEPGTAHNGLAPGQIDQLRTALPFVLSVTNTTESAGGADREDDERLTSRAADAHNRISKAGGRTSYDAIVRGFSPSIIDVAVIRPQAGHIHIHPLIDAGDGAVAPAAQFMADLLIYLDPEDSRPQGDDLSVLAPVPMQFTAEIEIVATGDLGAVEAKAGEAVTQVAAALERKLGAFVAAAAWTCAIKAIDGVVDASIAFTGLANRQLGETEFASLTGFTITMVEG